MTVCQDCGCECRGYDKREREWQHSDLFDMECHIHCAVDRMRCPKCGKVFLADVPWAGKGSGFTLLFEAKSLQLMGDMPVNSTARFPNVNDKRLWNVPDRSVEERMKGLDLNHMTRFYVDGTSCRKGHGHISIFADEDHEIVFVTDGNSADSVTRFREWLEEHGGKAGNMEYICCDMGKGFMSGMAREFPKAVVTYDRFHVMEHMTMTVDRARRHGWNVLREEGGLKEATDPKGQRFLLLRNNDNLSEWQMGKVKGILSSHAEIGTVYSLKESLLDTSGFDNRYDAANHPIVWSLTVEYTAIGASRDIIRLVDNRFDEIPNRFSSGMRNGVMEGIDSVIRAVKGRAGGYRDRRNLRTLCHLRGSGRCSVRGGSCRKSRRNGVPTRSRAYAGAAWVCDFLS